MDLLVAYKDDPAGYNMAKYLVSHMTQSGDLYKSRFFDLLIIPTPVVSADCIHEKYDYDSFVFLSKHAAESGVLALTCHSTGNFADARFGGRPGEVAIPYPSLQKQYLQNILSRKESFAGFEITIEATHHGPSALDKPCIFVEIGTTPAQWNDESLCGSVAEILLQTMQAPRTEVPFAICLGGTHYSTKFTHELLHGDMGLGTVVPKHGLEYLDRDLFDHILYRNKGATTILLDWKGLGAHKQKVMDLVGDTDLQIIKL